MCPAGKRPLAIAILLTMCVSGWCGSITVIGALSRQSVGLPGSSSDGSILVRNTSSVPQPVRVYQTDYLCYADGRVIFPEAGSTARSNAGWVTFTPRELDLAATSEATVRYQVQIPTVKTLSGTYWSIIMVEGLSDQLAGPKIAGHDGVGIQTVLRYGVQIVTDIGQSGKRNLRFSGEKITGAQGHYAFDLNLENIGERSLCPEVWVELFASDGKSLGRFAAERSRIFPACSTKFEMNLAQVPAGKYRALAVADNRDESIFGAQYQLELK
jgi:hypothetical protein